MSESKCDSRSGVSASRFDFHPGVCGSRFDSRLGVRSNEIIFPGKSPWRPCLRLLFLALACATVAVAFAASEDFRTRLRVERVVAPWAAALSGGVATLLFVCAAWTWITRLRWVAVSPDGLRWRRGPRARHARWDQYLGVRRGTIEVTVWGEELKAGRYADIEFRKGPALRISTYTIQGYEDLVAEIQTTAADAGRTLFPSGSGSRSGLTGPEATAYGPLRLHPNGLEWDGAYHGWDEIADYEVAVGYLRIQPTEGPEFLRRLSELGDWGPALVQLEANVGARQVALSSVATTAASEPAPAPPMAEQLEPAVK